jgi:hypothetical protein
MNPNRFCEKSIYWILSYRNAPRQKLHKLYRYGFIDDHTTESWEWTLRESDNIRKMGLEHWFTKTDGPYGFHYWQNKHITPTNWV